MVVWVLNVAEKPSVARSVSSILSGTANPRSREGRSRFNRVFEFDYAIRGQQCRMLMTSVTGHLMELEFDSRYRKWNSCDPAALYEAPVRKHVPEDKLDIKKTLEEEARKCQWLALWLDCDREGENIAFEVIEVCTSANQRLNIFRAHFSALIDREIHEAVQNLGRPNPLFADAVDARQEIDLRIGASFTRFQTMFLRDAFNLDVSGDDKNVVLSYGPCQFPTLGFVVERFWEIQSHEPEEFWTINCSHVSEDGSASFTWMRGHLFDYSSALIIYEMCVEESTATVTKVSHQEKRKYPPYPLNTVELQRRASQYFRMSSEHTMKVAEDLYQAGFISYPRTETDSFSANTNLHAIVQDQTGHTTWGLYAQRLLDPDSALWRNPGNGGHDDKAHPPIHPTKFSNGETSWSQDHNRLYELVVRHFLACVSQPAVGAGTTVEIDIAGESFKASGLMILAKNYLEVYRFESWGGATIPVYQFGQQFVPAILTLDSGITRPPPLLSESDLLGCMDKAGIGTDATMHDHIKKLLDRCYAVKDSSTRFSPTNLGEALVLGYDNMGYELWKPYLRSAMEGDMKAVSIGTKRKAEVLECCLQQMKACFLDVNLKHKDHYDFIWEIIDKRWDRQMHKPLHAAALYLNPGLYYEYEGIESNAEIKGGLFQVINILTSSSEHQEKVTSQLMQYRSSCGGFGLQVAVNARKVYAPAEWWMSFGYSCPELQQFAIKILSLTCSASPCERNWSTFEMARVQKAKLMEAMEIFFERRSNRNNSDENAGEIVRSCNMCQESEMVLRKKPDGNYMVGCLRFPLCRNAVWLPAVISEATVSENICTTCIPGPVFKIQFKFRRVEIPPTFSVDHLGCIGGCDEILHELTEICGTGSRNLSAASGQERRPMQPPRNNQAVNSRPQLSHPANISPDSVTGYPTIPESSAERQQILCDACQSPCVLRTANTSNNRGRKFYTCQSRECDFFIWEDNLQNGSRGRASRTTNRSVRAERGQPTRGRGRVAGSNGRGRSFVMATGEPTERRCFVCGDPSHFANACPNRAS